MSDKQLQAYRKYQRLVRTVLYCGGCLHSRRVSRISTFCLASLAIFLGNLNALNTLNYAYINRRYLFVCIKAIGQSTGSISIALKAGSMLLHRNILMEFHQTLDDLFEEELTRNEWTRMALLSRLNQYYIPSRIYPFLVGSTVIQFYVKSFKIIIHQIIHLQMPANYLRLNSEHLWLVLDGFWYHVYFLFDLGICWFLIFTTCASDILFSFYTYQISAILYAMSARLQNPQPDEKFSGILRTCAKKHKQLLQCRQYLERIYGSIIFWLILSSAVTMCALIYEAVPFSDLTFRGWIHFVCYMSLKLMQTFMFTWYGTTIITASKDFRQGIYCSGWPNALADRSLRTFMILTMMQETMKITALKIFTVSVESFITLINTTMSYFFLLQSVEQPQ